MIVTHVHNRTNVCGNAQKFGIGEDERVYVRRKFGNVWLLSYLCFQKEKMINNGREKEGQSTCH